MVTSQRSKARATHTSKYFWTVQFDLEDFRVLRRAKCLGTFAPAHQQAHVASKAGSLDCISTVELDSYPRVRNAIFSSYLIPCRLFAQL